MYQHVLIGMNGVAIMTCVIRIRSCFITMIWLIHGLNFCSVK
ncbi:hypothetical protein BMETH_1658_0 [methanotrophic bacterial endosymbiont of Bathymodiolus sp.]|nr:hypothetical protein BMETH_1658_0 [methanotrophic bacterial endosymbiont of Bathymodiolus sp.]